ncbi:MAG: Lrp/AsnC family transcriptional regulator [Methanothrix sp.]|jgi:DNA-binding Lrp family transcriptional regulator|uniref:siroheme decarboxylase subunit beta n=1 Tax=Methanothrix sp. TaxID=90426 RepID=UPI0026014704|nr:Lrp/AsnC family transcriptional regulator [Methanothrix sp.]MCK9405348.1 Lrp/AsnC family transcriptional regulator [Methanothrix sp.]
MDELDLELLKVAQDGLDLTERPYRVWGEVLVMGEEEIIYRLRAMEEEGIIRRFAATIGHRALGILANALIAWRVPPEKVDEAGAIFAAAEEVTHCYERATALDWPYNIYTMVHSRSREECLQIAERLSSRSGISDYIVLFSEKEYKKISARI